MKKIFIVKGKSGTGKSTIINDLIDWVLIKYPHCVNSIKTEGSGPDRYGTVQINKLIIGFVTGGDTHSYVKKRLDELHLLGCDIIVCSCRTKKSSFDAIWQFINFHFALGVQYLSYFIKIYPPFSVSQNTKVLLELQTWLIGLEK